MSDDVSENGTGHATETAKIGLPDGLMTLIAKDGSEFQLDPMATAKRFDALRKECDGKPIYDYLDAIIAHVKEKTGAELNLEQARWLDGFIEEMVLKKNAEQRKRRHDLLSLLGITEG